jgi:hypothetical protein
MKNDAIQEGSWQSMGQAWRNAPTVPSMSNDDVFTEVRKTAKLLFGLAIAAGSATIAVMTSLTTFAVCHRGILAWTFAVMGWSLFLPLAAYLIFHRKDIIAETLPTSSMLVTLLRKQKAKRNLLEFLYVLVSVETILASGFWLANQWHVHAPARAWPGFAGIFVTGAALSGLSRWQKARAETRLQFIADLGQALEDQD